MGGHGATSSYRLILQILTEDLDNGRVIYRSYAMTDPHSVKRNLNSYYWKSSTFVSRKLKDLHKQGPSSLDQDRYGSTYSPYSQRLYREPTNTEFSKLLVPFVGAYVRDKLRGLSTFEQWFVAFRVAPGKPGPDDVFHRFKHLSPPKDRVGQTRVR